MVPPTTPRQPDFDPLRCVQCKEVQRTGTLLGCTNRHLACKSCRVAYGGCPAPECPNTRFQTPLRGAEKIRADRLQDPTYLWDCRYYKAGCRKRLTSANIEWHEASCGFSLAVCPSHHCTWEGHAGSYAEHVIASFCGDIVPLHKQSDTYFGYIRDTPRTSILDNYDWPEWASALLISSEHSEMNLMAHFAYAGDDACKFSVSTSMPAEAIPMSAVSVRITLYEASSRLRPWALMQEADVKGIIQHAYPEVCLHLLHPPLTLNPTVPLPDKHMKTRSDRGRQNESHYFRSKERRRELSAQAAAHQDSVRAAEALLTLRKTSSDKQRHKHGSTGPGNQQDKGSGDDNAARKESDNKNMPPPLPPSPLGYNQLQIAHRSRMTPTPSAAVLNGHGVHHKLMSSLGQTMSVHGRLSSRAPHQKSQEDKGVRLTVTKADMRRLHHDGILFAYSIQIIKNARPM